ncbi:MAG TPA: caspase family protein [Pseudonocardiaceae bacterium]|nr:caspase family protein [Pseudonocardiaceae bacterium]
MSGRRTALIVASGDYDHEGLRQLLSPAADAQALAAVLGDPQIGGFDVQDVHNETAHVIQARIEDLFSEAVPDDLLLVHLSCHGLKNDSGELFFAALQVAAGAHEALAEIARTDIHYLAEAAATALREVAIKPAERELHFGQVARGAIPPRRSVRLQGSPLARACTARASESWIRIDEAAEGIQVSVDTSRVGTFRGEITITGPTGEAVIPVSLEITSAREPPPPAHPSPVATPGPSTTSATSPAATPGTVTTAQPAGDAIRKPARPGDACGVWRRLAPGWLRCRRRPFGLDSCHCRSEPGGIEKNVVGRRIVTHLAHLRRRAREQVGSLGEWVAIELRRSERDLLRARTQAGVRGA